MKKLLLTLLLSLGLIGTTSADTVETNTFDDIVETNTLKLKALNACVSCNLNGADLRRADLWGAKLYKADLSEVNLTGADLRYADLSGADLSGATLCNTETPWGIDDSGC